MAKTKLIRIRLAALTRVEYSEVVEVPANITEEELEALVDRRCDEVDGGEYVDDPDFWERGDSCGFEDSVREDESPSKRVRRQRGDLVVTDVEGPNAAPARSAEGAKLEKNDAR